MPSRPRKPSRKPPTTIKPYPDGHKKKRSPNGVRSVLLAIQYYWLSLIAQKKDLEHLTAARFCANSEFEKVFQQTCARYPAMSKKPEKLYRVLQKLTLGEHNIEFVHLLAFSQFVGLPLSLFLLFTQMVSDELRALEGGPDFRSHAVDVLRRIRFVVELAERQVAQSRPGEHLFIHFYDEFDDPGRFMAKAISLKTWSDAFNSTEARALAAKDVRSLQDQDEANYLK